MSYRDLLPEFCRREVEVIAEFGQAKLVKDFDGTLELRGGTKDDILAAREWISLFMPYEVIRQNVGNAGS